MKKATSWILQKESGRVGEAAHCERTIRQGRERCGQELLLRLRSNEHVRARISTSNLINALRNNIRAQEASKNLAVNPIYPSPSTPEGLPTLRKATQVRVGTKKKQYYVHGPAIDRAQGKRQGQQNKSQALNARAGPEEPNIYFLPCLLGS